MHDNIKSNNNLAYKGTVIAKILKGNRVIKTITKSNNGTNNLFNALKKALIQSYAADDMPYAIDCGSLNSVNNFASAIAEPAIINSRIIANDNYVHLLATIPSGSFDGSQIQNFNLLDKNKKILAEIELDNPVDIAQGNSLLVEWTMDIGNSVKE